MSRELPARIPCKLSDFPYAHLEPLTLVRSYTGPDITGELYRGDALEFLRATEAESCDLVFLDPPFNLGKDYGPELISGDRMPVAEYRAWMQEILTQSVRVLSPGGALFLYHLPVWAIQLGADLNEMLTFRHWIAISMKNGFARGVSLYPAHYALLYFTKGDPTTFTRPKLSPQLCRHCGNTVKDYGGYKPIIDEKGINLSDVWDDLSPVRHRANKKREPNQLPSTLTERVVAISGAPGKMFLDPFSGSGTAVVSAVRAGMFFRACDLTTSNCNVIHKSLSELSSLNGNGVHHG